MNDSSGKVIIINGPSSAGKTTLARAVQDQIDIPFLHFSFDVLREQPVLPMKRIRSGAFSWQSMRSSVFEGVHRCVPALALAGNNVIFDHIIETPVWLAQLVDLLAGLDVFLVGLHCSLAELERREQERGNRRPGEARADLESVHSFMRYDLELNSELPSGDNARRLIMAWKQRRSPSVFDQLTAAKA